MPFKTRSLHHKILLLSIPIIIILLAVTQILYSMSYSVLVKQILETTQVQSRNVISVLESETLRLNYLQANLLEDSNLKTFVYYGDMISSSERLRVQNLIIDKIQEMSLFTSYIQTVNILASDGEDVHLISSEPSPANYDDLVSIFQNGVSYRYIARNGRIYLRLSDQEYTQTGKSAAVIIEVAQKQLIDQIGSMLDYHDSVAVLSFDDSEFLLVNSPNPTLAAQSFSHYIHSGEDKIRIGREEFALSSAYSSQLGIHIHKFVPTHALRQPLGSFQATFIIFAALCVLCALFFYFKSRTMIREPLQKMLASFKEVENGNLDNKIYHKGNDEFSYIFRHYNDMLDNLKVTIRRMNEFAVLKQRAELKQLQTQINPHFLYNSFYTQRRMLKMGDYEALDELTDHLSKYFEYLHNNEEDDIPLIREVQHAQSYLAIQTLRFKNRIHTSFAPLREEWSDFSVPRLILQPVLENAFAYTLEDKTNDGILDIYFEYEEDAIRIVVEDNGDTLMPDDIVELNREIQENETGISALININRRLRLRYGDGSGVTLALSRYGHGLKVIEEIHVRQGG